MQSSDEGIINLGVGSVPELLRRHFVPSVLLVLGQLLPDQPPLGISDHLLCRRSRIAILAVVAAADLGHHDEILDGGATLVILCLCLFPCLGGEGQQRAAEGGPGALAAAAGMHEPIHDARVEGVKVDPDHVRDVGRGGAADVEAGPLALGC